MKAPSSPQRQSGAQGSHPKGSQDLEQQESDMLSQLDNLTMESVKLDTLPNPRIGQKARARSIQLVIQDLDMKLQELASQREARSSAKARKTQEGSVPATKPSPSSTLDKPKATLLNPQMVVKPVAPPTLQPLTVEQLMANLIQPVVQSTQAGDVPKSQPQPPQIPQPVSQPVLPKPNITCSVKTAFKVE